MLYESEQGNISIALAGDAMITRQMRPFREENFLKMQSLLQNADASIVNLEMLFKKGSSQKSKMKWMNYMNPS